MKFKVGDIVVAKRCSIGGERVYHSFLKFTNYLAVGKVVGFGEGSRHPYVRSLPFSKRGTWLYFKEDDLIKVRDVK